MDERGTDFNGWPEDTDGQLPRIHASQSEPTPSPVRARRRRVGPIAMAAVVAAVGAAGAAYVVGLIGKHDATPIAAKATPMTTTSPAGGPTAAAPSTSQPPTATATSASATAAATSSPPPPSAGLAGLVTPTPAEKAVGTLYGFADAALAEPGAVPLSPAAVDAVFRSRAVEVQYWNAGTHRAQAAAMCGATAPNLAIVAPSPSGVTVSFYEKGRLTATQAEVSIDQSTQKIASISCAKSTPPAFTGAQKLVQYYSAGLYRQTISKLPTPSKSYAPASANDPQGWLNFDTATCAQYPPISWVFYAPVATTSGDAWRFTYDGGMDRGIEVLFTDPSTGTFERTLCGGFPDIPAPDEAAAGTTDRDPATILIDNVYDAYIYERAQQSLGAVPTDEIAPYFASPEAYKTALKTTGAIPFLCAGKPPNVVTATGSTVVGDTETIAYTAGYADPPTPGATPAPVGGFTVSVDLSTMKIKALTCT